VLPDKLSFFAGDTIHGKVRLNLKQPKKARALRLEFYGEIKERHHSRNGTHTHTRRINHAAQQLSPEKTFSPGEEFGFSFICPPEIGQAPPQQGGIFGGIISTLQSFAPKPIYYIHATLDAQMEFDINKRVQVQIVPRQ
jgi:hypothetical protein